MVGEWSSSFSSSGELRLRRAAAAEHVDLAGLVGAQGLVHVVRDLGDVQLIAGLRQNARDVQADVAHADDGDGLGRQVPLAGELGVRVVEADELAGAMVALQVRAGDVQVAIAGCAGREHDGVVKPAQFRDGHVAPDVDVAQKADLGLVQHAVQGLDDALDARMIGSDAVADEAERRGQALENVDGHVAAGLHQGIRGVDARGAGSDDGDSKLSGSHGIR